MSTKAGIVIIGGGIIGCSIAYYLAKRGITDVILIERKKLAAAETSHSAAMVMHQTMNQTLTMLAKKSFEEYQRYLDPDTNRPILITEGSILFTCKEAKTGEIAEMVNMQNRIGIPSSLLDPSDISKYIPFANTTGMLKAAYCPTDGHVSTAEVVKLYSRYIVDRGGQIKQDVTVLGLQAIDGHVTAVETTSGLIETRIVVNAAGAMAGRVAQYLGLQVPIQCNKRNMLILPPSAAPGSFPIFEDIDDGYYIRPDATGVLLGIGPTTDVTIDSDDPDILSPEFDDSVMVKVQEYLSERLPSLAGVSHTPMKRWAGVRSFTPDGLPILGGVDGLNGYINCCGMSGFGVTLAPACGEMISELIVDGRTQVIPIEPFLLSRFDNYAGQTMPATPGANEKDLSSPGHDQVANSHNTDSFVAWEVINNNLVLGDLPVAQIASRYGTPLYLYDGNILIEKLRSLREAFPGFEILYSLKANPNPAIAELLIGNGTGAAVASLDERRIALAALCPHDNIAYGGPGKSAIELEQLVKEQIGIVDVESVRELRILEELARQYRSRIPVTLRVNTIYRPGVAGEFMAGEGACFGFDEETIVDEIGWIQESKYIAPVGIHAHVASQVLDPNTLAGYYRQLATLSKSLARELNFDLKVINFGGGIGIPYHVNDTAIDLKQLGSTIVSALKDLFSDATNVPVFQMEPGRYLTAEAGLFLTEIVDVKYSRGKGYIVTDSGISGFARPAMPWAQQHPCSIASKMADVPTGMFKVVGRSCMTSDVLCEAVMLPDPQPGDILAFRNAGAYGYTMSLLKWGSHKVPSEVLFDRDFKIISQRYLFPGSGGDDS